MQLRGSIARMLIRYLTAAAAVAATAGLTAVSWPLAESTPFAGFFAAVMVTAWTLGAGPSLLATALSILAISYWFVPPYHSLAFGPEAAAGMVVFWVVSTFIGAFAAARSAVEARARALAGTFEGIATSIADAVARTDASGRVTFLNAAAERLSGWSSAEAVGRPLVDVMTLATGEAAEALVGPPSPGQTRRFDRAEMTARDGTVRIVGGSVAPIVDDSGYVVGSVLSCRDVGDRLRDLEALRRAEALNREMLGSGLDCLKILSLDGRIISMNEAGCRLLGVDDFEDVRGRVWADLLPEPVRGRVRQAVERAAGGQPDQFDASCPTLKNVPKEWEVHLAPILGADGRPEQLYCVSRDVTERVRSERERERLLLDLKHERSTLEAVIQNAPAFICTLRGPDHVFALANRRFYDIAGDRNLIGRTVRDAFPDLEGQGFLELLDQVYRSGEPFAGKEMPILLRRKGGGVEKRILNFVYQAMYEADGEVSGIFVHGVDVTDLVIARESVRESEARFRQLADAMPQAVWAARSDGTVDYFNRKWREYGDYPEGTLGTLRWALIIHPDDIERARSAWEESVRTGRPFEVEYRLRRASDGSHRWHLGRALPIEDSNGRIVRWFGTNTDVDDVKRLSEALQQADRRKDEFLATLAHELRNPLAPLRNGLAILELGPPADAARSTIEMMTRQLGHMVHLVDDLMDVARVRSGKITLHKQRVELQAVVTEAVEANRQYVESSRHELATEMLSEPITIDADPTRLAQVISNLLSNAAKYTEPGGRIEATVTREMDEAVVRVRDTGVGLAPEMLPKIFDMFTQVNASLHRARGGLGIGLTIVRRLVEMHGGRVEARSDGPGRGSEFIVYLPIVDVAPPESDGPARPDAGRRASADAIRVLVVDDVRDSADSLARLLRLNGHDVHTAYDGEQALAAAAAFPPDVILLDLGLPDKNGYEVAAELRAAPRFRDAMLVALTGWGQPEDRRRSAEAGFDHHLVKPVEIDVLRNIIAVVAQSAQGRGRAAPAVQGGS